MERGLVFCNTLSPMSHFLSRLSHFLSCMSHFISHVTFFISHLALFYLACRIFILHLAFLSRMLHFLSRMSHFLSHMLHFLSHMSHFLSHILHFFISHLAFLSHLPPEIFSSPTKLHLECPLQASIHKSIWFCREINIRFSSKLFACGCVFRFCLELKIWFWRYLFDFAVRVFGCAVRYLVVP